MTQLPMPHVPEIHAHLRRAVAAGALRPRRTRRPWLAAVALTTGLAVSGTALAASGLWRPMLGSERGGHLTASARPAPVGFAAALGVLRRPQAEADQGPAVQHALTQLSTAGADGVHVRDVRLLGTHRGGAAILVTVDRTGPGERSMPQFDRHDQLCVIYEHGLDGGAAQNCGDAAELNRRGIGGWLQHDVIGRGNEPTIITGLAESHHYGLVPDGVARVRLHLGGRQVLVAAVRGNFYDATTMSTRPAYRREWLAADGSVVGP